MANNNFAVKNGLIVNGSFTANSTVVNAAAVTATSVDATTLSISGSSVATLITSNASAAYTNATTYADTKSSAAYTNAITFSAIATNITSGTLPDARLSSAVVNTSGTFTVGGRLTFSNVVTFSNTIAANGSNGTSGQLLTSSGPSGNVYWSTVFFSTNTAAAFSWTNTHIFSNTVTVNSSTLSIGSATVNTSVTLGTITISNGAAVATVNSTVYSGTANNAAALSGLSLSTIQGQITGNSTTAYSNAVANAAALYQTTAGLSANVVKLSANNSTYLNSQLASYYTDITARLGYTPVNRAGDTAMTGNFSTSGAQIAVGRGEGGQKELALVNSNRNVYLYLAADGNNVGIWDTNAARGRFHIDNTGNMYVWNSITAGGNITAYSDVKLKTNIHTITGALDKVKNLRGVSYQRISDNSNNIGVIAQEILEVIPEVVMKDSSDTMSVAYGNLVGLLIEAIKELSAEVQALKISTCKCECK